jgi:large subunit ribosomal protein L18e
MVKISKTKIDKKARRKTNPRLKDLIITLKKQGDLELANILAQPRRKAIVVNIEKINRETKPGDKVIVPGKLLGKGEMQHAITIAAFSFSQEAIKKLKSCKIVKIEDIANDKDVKVIH